MPQVERKLTTILVTDVVGFSGMMGRDEPRTLRVLKACHEIIGAAVDEHGGRVFGHAGDSLIAEFASPLSAVLCAGSFQDRIAARNRAAAEGEQMWFRAGINLGDVMVDGDNLYGEGVNVAARLEPEAEPGGICISHKVHEEVRRHAPVVFVDGGMRRLKNIDQPVGVFHVRPAGEESLERGDSVGDAPDSAAAAGPSAATSHTVTVRPLKVVGDEDAQLIAEGLGDALLNSMSKYSVIDVLHQQPDSDARAEFCLEGSVRSRGGQTRLTFNLVETATGRQIWSERYGRDGADPFELEEEIARAVAAGVREALTLINFERLRDSADEDLSSDELRFKAASYIGRGPGDNDAAEAALRVALARDPDDAMAAAALSHVLYRGFEFTPLALPHESIETITGLAEHAVALGTGRYFPWLGAAIAWQDLHGDFERALRYARSGLEANPDHLGSHGMVAIATFHLGDQEAGLRALRRTIDASKTDPQRWRHQRELAIAQFAAGDLDAAEDTICGLVQSVPQLDRNKLVQAVMLQLCGDSAAAGAIVRQLEARYPALSASTARPTRFGDPAAAARFAEALAACWSIDSPAR